MNLIPQVGIITHNNNAYTIYFFIKVYFPLNFAIFRYIIRLVLRSSYLKDVQTVFQIHGLRLLKDVNTICITAGGELG